MVQNAATIQSIAGQLSSQTGGPWPDIAPSRRPLEGQQVSSISPRLDWPTEGLLFEPDLNKCQEPEMVHSSSYPLDHY